MRHGITRLREEMRILADVQRAIMPGDYDDPTEYHRVCGQLGREMAETRTCLTILEAARRPPAPTTGES